MQCALQHAALEAGTKHGCTECDHGPVSAPQPHVAPDPSLAVKPEVPWPKKSHRVFVSVVLYHDTALFVAVFYFQAGR